MDRLQFHFKVLSAQDEKSNVLCITKISTPDGHTYRIPQDYLAAGIHEELSRTSIFARVKKTCTQRGQVRRIWITLTRELKKVYFDEEENLQFQDEYLEEIIEDANINSNLAEQPLIQMLEKLLEKNQERTEEKNIGKIAKEFIIEKFDGKNSNVHQWMSNFEKECERFNITTEEKKIEILKSFMDRGASDWYSCTLLKLTIEAEWKDWKENFLNTFACKGWSPIRYAMTFKYQTGSLLEYSIKKEKLLLQVRQTIDNGTLIDLIATGLPNYVADRIDREKLQKTEDLHNEIGKLEHLANKKNLETRKNSKLSDRGIGEKTQCKICKDKEKGIRFHPESECWFKAQENKGNSIKQVNNLTLGVELSNDDPKN
ncbi:uncharacterized protein LOC125502044 [Athalia rosae]|uniref:uncharacterized protein LOC125502044 n=1 Tax=Athalia rosae TaxID=37344 RepID=UPI0020337032|nr:uncharacterized protein LOC125502044 [Athalia rosae]